MPPSRKSGAESQVTLSVLDRLVDRDPRNQGEEAATRAQSVRELKAGIRRDIEWLLNTRRIAVEPDEGLRELAQSVYVYGLPDFTAFSLASHKDQSKLVRSLQWAIRHFEPRLANVQIIPIKNEEAGSRTLRFRIEGLLLMDPAPEFVAFDTFLDLTSSAYTLQGEANAG
ncbi:MAG: type VI secretion system baseplate subunit TssE [Acidobacteriia bacterium]|nr:type VI secretion system baseplate subunit TssE [Terriglobia bacterium]